MEKHGNAVSKQEINKGDANDKVTWTHWSAGTSIMRCNMMQGPRSLELTGTSFTMSEFTARPNAEAVLLAGGLNIRSIVKIRSALAQNHL